MHDHVDAVCVFGKVMVLIVSVDPEAADTP